MSAARSDAGAHTQCGRRVEEAPGSRSGADTQEALRPGTWDNLGAGRDRSPGVEAGFRPECHGHSSFGSMPQSATARSCSGEGARRWGQTQSGDSDPPVTEQTERCIGFLKKGICMTHKDTFICAQKSLQDTNQRLL